MAKQNNKIQEVFLSILDFCISNENIVNNTIKMFANVVVYFFFGAHDSESPFIISIPKHLAE